MPLSPPLRLAVVTLGLVSLGACGTVAPTSPSTAPITPLATATPSTPVVSNAPVVIPGAGGIISPDLLVPSSIPSSSPSSAVASTIPSGTKALTPSQITDAKKLLDDTSAERSVEGDEFDPGSLN